VGFGGGLEVVFNEQRDYHVDKKSSRGRTSQASFCEIGAKGSLFLGADVAYAVHLERILLVGPERASARNAGFVPLFTGGRITTCRLTFRHATAVFSLEITM
jgi:hypothetical protein